MINRDEATLLKAQIAAKAEIVSVFAGLSELVYAGASVADVLEAVARSAPLLITGCDHASIMLTEGGAFRTAASSDDVAIAVDQLERSLGDGPCVDAITEESFQMDPDLTDGSQWPRLAAAVLEQTSVRGMAGYRIAVDGEKVGALNVFSDTPHAMNEASAAEGVVLASFTAVALTAARRQEQIDALRLGLVSNREIAKATGLLMSAYKITSEEAFERLRRTSNDLNIKLAVIAKEVVDHHDRGRVAGRANS